MPFHLHLNEKWMTELPKQSPYLSKYPKKRNGALLLGLSLQSKDINANIALLLSSWPPEDHTVLWRRGAGEFLPSVLQQWSHSCAGVQVRRGIPVMWNVKAALAQSLAFLVFASMEENILPTCYSGWYVREVRNLESFTSHEPFSYCETVSSDTVKYALIVVRWHPSIWK